MSEQPEVQTTVALVRELWNKMAMDGATDSAKVDSSARAQRMRFETFLLEHDLAGKTILDVGCGVGDFWAHLRRRQIDCEYLGIDLSPEMVRRSQERFPEATFEARDLLAWSPAQPFDYVV